MSRRCSRRARFHQIQTRFRATEFHCARIQFRRSYSANNRSSPSFFQHMADKFALRSQAWALCVLFPFLLALTACGGSSSSSESNQPQNPVGANLVQISSDSFTVAPGQYATEVEPHMISN